MSAEICPVCGGCGRYWPAPDSSITALPAEQACHGCRGSGWVETHIPDPSLVDIYNANAKFPLSISTYPQVIHNSVSEKIEGAYESYMRMKHGDEVFNSASEGEEE